VIPASLLALTRNRPAAAGTFLLVGFTGSVVGLVYGWPLQLDRTWFFIWFIIACIFGGAGIWEWYQDRVRELRAEDHDSSRTLE